MSLSRIDPGDFEIVDAFINNINDNERPDPLTSAEASLESHLMAFAAEKSRLEETIIDMDLFRGKLKRT